MKLMRDIHFNSYKDLAKEVTRAMDYVESSISIVCFYDAAREIIKDLLLTNRYSIADIEISSVECSGYDREYYISVEKFSEKGKFNIWCETAMKKNSDKYIYCDSDLCYVMDNCHSSILSAIRSTIKCEVSIGDDETDNGENDCCCNKLDATPKENACETDDMNGFTISTSCEDKMQSLSFYSNRNDMIDAMLEWYKASWL